MTELWLTNAICWMGKMACHGPGSAAAICVAKELAPDVWTGPSRNASFPHSSRILRDDH
jgi:hypothetical protein